MKLFFIVERPPTDVGRAELHAAYHAVTKLPEVHVVRIPSNKMGEIEVSPQDVLWWHWPAEKLPETTKKTDPRVKLQEILKKGTNVLLTLGGVMLQPELGVEAPTPDIMEIGRWRGETGAYASRGFMAFSRHPLFNNPHILRTNAFTWTPNSGEPYWRFAYGESQPQNVIARGCGYISIITDRAAVWETALGSGKLLCVGSFLYFNARRNYHRRHAEAFLENCLHYLTSSPENTEDDLHWPEPQTGCEEAHAADFIHLPDIRLSYPPEQRFSRPGLAALQNYPGSNLYCCAARRILLTGNEGENIQEIWSFPHRIIKDIRWTLYPGEGEGIPQEALFSEATNYPDAIHARYEGEMFGVLEQIGTSIYKPAAFQQLEIVSEVDFHLEFSFLSDLAMMWPMPIGAIGKIRYRYDPVRNTINLLSEAKCCWSLIGLSKVPDRVEFEDLSNKEASLLKCKVRLPRMKAGLHYVSLTFLGGRVRRGFEPDINTATYMDIDRSADHYRKIQESIVMISSPVADLDQALEWTQLSLEGFLAVTPNVGRSLTAGYAHSGEGWLSTRPGYGWYFGRDSLWTCLGLLSAGRWNMVADTLRFLASFQGIDGKIIHEVSPSDYAHYDSADANPLFLIVAERYLAWTGDDQTIRSLLPPLRKALEFSFEMDRDRDGLTENTGVGHGWIEGGGLFGAHVTFYLAGIWLRALESAKSLFSLEDDKEMLERLDEASLTVREAIKTRFWDKENETYYYGQLKDGSMNSADTIMPAPVILFGDTDPEQDDKFLKRVSGPDIVTDWGARMISELDKRYNPEGYHIGSVWPLYTGWLGLAQYKRGRPLQGYGLLRAGAANFNHFSVGGFSEVLRGDVYRESGVCPDQAWSAALLLALFTFGLLGLEAETGGRLLIRPDIPPDWRNLDIENIRWADGVVDIGYRRDGLEVTFILRGIKKGDRLTLAPFFPKGSRIASIKLDGEDISPSLDLSFGRPNPCIPLDDFEGEVTIKFTQLRYLSPLPPMRMPEVGKPSKGFRILDWDHGIDHIWIELMGRSGADEEITMVDPGDILTEHDLLCRREGEKKIIKFRFPSKKEPYSKVTLRFVAKADTE